MTEPQGGADIENVEILGGSTIQTTAVLDGDEWVINGHKLWPTNSGGVCNLFSVICTTDPGVNDPDNFAFIFAPACTPGVTQGGPYEKAGMAADKNGDIWFENVRVPSWYRAFGPGLDFEYFKEVIALGNMGSIAFVSGVMMNIYERLYDFVTEHTFGKKALKEHDAVAGVLADFAATLEVIRIVGYQLARMMDRPDIYGPRYAVGERGQGARLQVLRLRPRRDRDRPGAQPDGVPGRGPRLGHREALARPEDRPAVDGRQAALPDGGGPLVLRVRDPLGEVR